MVSNLDVLPKLREFLDTNAESILDVGCGGLAPTEFWEVFYHIPIKYGIDINLENIIKNREKFPDGIFICMDVMLLDKIKLPHFDVVHSQNLIEHLNKKEALLLIEMMEKIAKKQVILGTPKGFRQPEFKNLSYYEIKNFAERHLCEFTKEELQDLGYEVFEYADYYLCKKVKKNG